MAEHKMPKRFNIHAWNLYRRLNDRVREFYLKTLNSLFSYTSPLDLQISMIMKNGKHCALLPMINVNQQKISI